MRIADFDGETYDHDRDYLRLVSAFDRIFAFMRRGGWWTLERLAEVGRCTPQAASARVRDFRKRKFGGHTVDHRHVGGGLWVYRLTVRRDDEEPRQLALV